MNPYIQALAGGLIMGIASVLLFAANGRILGISGVLGGALRIRTTEARWRWAFVLGMLAAGTSMVLLMPQAFADTVQRSPEAYVVAGILVGVGTQLGSGCTSGHGICGIGRMSMRSVFATLVFMASGAATVLVVRYLFGGVV